MTHGPVGLGRFSRSQRLLLTGDFARIRAKGQRLAMGCMIANWLPREPEPHSPLGMVPSRLGVVVSRKLGKATVRNRAKRLLREAFRRNQDRLTQGLDLVLVARPSIVGLDYGKVDAQYLRLLHKAELLASL
jgi:ribonuclease P protein component